MASQRPAIRSLLNGPSPVPDPSPGPSPSPPPQPAPPPPPAAWPAPPPPSSGATGSITYTQSALAAFAQTSQRRASAFGQAGRRARQIHVSGNAFGVLFGQLAEPAYERHAQAVSRGIQSAELTMSGIAAAIRKSAARIHAVNSSIEQNLNTIDGPS